MYYKTLLVYLFSVTICTGCTKEEIRDSVAYEVILESHLSYSEVETIPEQVLVIKKEADWNNFIGIIKQVNPSRADHLKGLEFDLENYSLIIIIGKYFTYCCSKITVDGVYKEDDDMVVKYEESGPGMAAALSQAYTILQVAKLNADQ